MFSYSADNSIALVKRENILTHIYKYVNVIKYAIKYRPIKESNNNMYSIHMGGAKEKSIAYIMEKIEYNDEYPKKLIPNWKQGDLSHSPTL